MGRYPRLSIDRDEVIRRYLDGESSGDIATSLQVSRGAINGIIKRAGIRARSMGDYYPVDEDEIVRLYVEQELSLKRIADRLHTNTARATAVLHSHGVKMRPKSRPPKDSYENEFKRQKKIVRARSKGLCEGGGPPCTNRAYHVHHRKLRSRGGDNSLENLVDLCHRCHAWAHRCVRAAGELGLIVSSWDDPGAVPLVRFLDLPDEDKERVLASDNYPCGTASRYWQGCRCAECRSAVTLYLKQKRKR